jgi:phage FluMu gp28-like protein
MAAEAVLTAATADGGMNVWYVGYNRDMTLEWINDCASWAESMNVAASAMEEEVLTDEDRNIQAFRIKFASGHRITALSSRPSNLRGKQGLVVIDEAAFHDALGELLKAALALLIWGGKVAIVSTHDGVENPFNDLVEDCRAKRRPYSLHRITFDQALEEGLYKRICLKRGLLWSAEAEAKWRAGIRKDYGPDAEEELDCIPKGGGGAYLPRALIEKAMRAPGEVIRLTKGDAFGQGSDESRQGEIAEWLEIVLAPILLAINGQASSYGFDFGRSGDLSVLCVLQETVFMGYGCPLLLELRNIPFRQQEQILFKVVDSLPNFNSGAHDARGNGQYLAEVASQRYGADRIESVMLSTEWYRQHMPPLKAAFEDATLTLPRDADVLGDLRSILVDKGVAKVSDRRTRGADGGQRHGDAAVALALAFAAARRECAPIAYRTLGMPRAGVGREGLYIKSRGGFGSVSGMIRTL